MAESSQNWTGNLLRYLGARSCLDFGLRECTVKLFEATNDDHHECLDMQSKPHRYSELVVGVLLNREKLPKQRLNTSLVDAKVVLSWRRELLLVEEMRLC